MGSPPPSKRMKFVPDENDEVFLRLACLQDYFGGVGSYTYQETRPRLYPFGFHRETGRELTARDYVPDSGSSFSSDTDLLQACKELLESKDSSNSVSTLPLSESGRSLLSNASNDLSVSNENCSASTVDPPDLSVSNENCSGSNVDPPVLTLAVSREESVNPSELTIPLFNFGLSENPKQVTSTPLEPTSKPFQ